MTHAVRKSKQRPSKKNPRRMPRSMIEKMLTDLCERLKQQVNIAEAIANVATPTGETLWGAYPMLKVIELAAKANASDLQQAAEFAKIINGMVAP
jgi:hypothetical protein